MARKPICPPPPLLGRRAGRGGVRRGGCPTCRALGGGGVDPNLYGSTTHLLGEGAGGFGEKTFFGPKFVFRRLQHQHPFLHKTKGPARKPIFPTPPLRRRGSHCVTFRRAAVSLRGPGQSPFLPFACCVGLLRSDGRRGLCSFCGVASAFAGPSSWRTGGCAGCCGGRFSVLAAHSAPHSGRPPPASLCVRGHVVRRAVGPSRGPGQSPVRRFAGCVSDGPRGPCSVPPHRQSNYQVAQSCHTRPRAVLIEKPC